MMASGPSSKAVVFVVDDDVSVRESLELLIQAAGWRPQTFESPERFLACPLPNGPSCLVLDVSMPGLNGLELQEHVAAQRSDMPIIFITGHGDIPTSVRAMKAGAVEFLTKPFQDDVLLRAVASAIERSRRAVSEDSAVRGLKTRFASLTRREQQVLSLVVSGRLNKQIAGELHISEITVKAHRGKVMRKMQAGSLADLVRMASRLQPTQT